MHVSQVETTGAFRIKVLEQYLSHRRSTRDLQAFRARVGAARLVDDETRPVSRALWLRGLTDFVRICGEGALAELGPYFLRSEMLGVWAEPLRASKTVDQLFEKLVDDCRLPGDAALRWLTKEPGAWHGQPLVLESDTPEERRFMLAALRSELEIVPRLLGLQGEATITPDATLRVRVVDPRLPNWLPLGLSLGVLALPLGVAHFSAPSLTVTASEAAVALLAGAATYAVFLFLRWDESRRRVSLAQSLRILALERESTLRRHTPREISRPDQEPALAGQYRIGAQLGVGGAGAVWHAIRLRDGRPVALKLIRTGVAHDVRATDRLRREAEALGLAWHPNVVEIYDTGMLPSGVAYLAMERLYGESLAERLLRESTMTYERTRALALELADALIAIHSAGLIHRDIKPGNLFLHRGADPESSATGVETLKIIDFGVARITWAETRLTRAGTRIGTLGYAAPEQEQGDEVDGRADLYAAGITLRECLTGLGPGPQKAGEKRGDLPRAALAFAPLLERLTHRDPAERPATARDFRDLVLALPLAGGTALTYEPPEPAVRSRKQ